MCIFIMHTICCHKVHSFTFGYYIMFLRHLALYTILYYPDICCPNISQMTREVKLIFLPCISAIGEPRLQQWGLQIHLGDEYLQTQASDYHILVIIISYSYSRFDADIAVVQKDKALKESCCL